MPHTIMGDTQTDDQSVHLLHSHVSVIWRHVPPNTSSPLRTYSS